VEIDVMLCNHAEAAENKLFLTGGGINMSFVGPEPPHVVSVAVGGVVHVPYQSTDQVVVSLDQQEMRRLSLRVTTPPPGMVPSSESDEKG
jgi:hypothetical protein